MKRSDILNYCRSADIIFLFSLSSLDLNCSAHWKLNLTPDVENDPLDTDSRPTEVRPEDVQVEEAPSCEGREAEQSDSAGDKATEMSVVQEEDVPVQEVTEPEEQKDNDSSLKGTRESSDVEIISSSEGNTGEKIVIFIMFILH